jgi:hypothetical protein
MPSIRRDVVVDAAIETVWASLRDVGRARDLFAPVLADSRLQGDVRSVRFANGMETRERILDVDEEHRRVAYTALDTPLDYHHGSMQLETAGPGRCVFIWITDFMPATAAEMLTPLIEQGTAALKRNVERDSAVAAGRSAAHSPG